VAFGDPVPKGAAPTASASLIPGRPDLLPEETSTREGACAWYGDEFHGRQPANGEVFDMER